MADTCRVCFSATRAPSALPANYEQNFVNRLICALRDDLPGRLRR
jgi:hypothetical protein